MLTDPHDWRRFDRYLAGECTPAEAAEVERWIAARPELQALRLELRRRDPGAAPVRVDTAWQQLSARLRAGAAARVSAPPLAPAAATRDRGWQPRLARTTRWLRAAVVLLVAGGAATIWTLQRSVANPRAALPVELVAAAGERRAVTLPDGTEVILDASSRLRYPGAWADTLRLLHLEGGAYFRVAPSPRRPFVIRVADAEVRVLGTSFEVRAFPEAGGVRVFVNTGVVGLRPVAREAFGVRLKAGDLGHLQPDGTVAVTRDVDVAARLAWLSGRVVFHDVALAEALPDLERRFNVEIRLADATIGQRRLDLDLQPTSLEAVLEAIALSLDLSYQRDSRALVLKPKRAQLGANERQ